MRTSVFLSLILSLGFFVFCKQVPNQTAQEKPNQSKQDQTEWVPPTVNGIVLGKSKYDDIVKLWGKPEYEKELIPNESEPQIIYTELGYQDVTIDGFTRSFAVLVNAETQIVSSITTGFFENIKDEMIQKYGSDYYVVFNNESECIDTTKKRNRKRKPSNQSDYPISLVYPRKGMFFTVHSDDFVMLLVYSDKCS